MNRNERLFIKFTTSMQRGTNYSITSHVKVQIIPQLDVKLSEVYRTSPVVVRLSFKYSKTEAVSRSFERCWYLIMLKCIQMMTQVINHYITRFLARFLPISSY